MYWRFAYARLKLKAVRHREVISLADGLLAN
jgi:hypothetical protein